MNHTFKMTLPRLSFTAFPISGASRRAIVHEVSSFAAGSSQRTSLIAKFPARTLTTTGKNKKDDDDDKDKDKRYRKPLNAQSLAHFAKTDLVPASLRGVSQVVFVDHPKSGMAMLAGLALGDPWLAAMAGWGSVTSTMTARMARLDGSALQSGLLGYNGCLVGCAATVFIAPESLTWALLSTTTGAMATPFVTMALGQAMRTVSPQWTFAFNFVTLTTLLRTRPLATTATPAAVDVAAADTVSLVTATPTAVSWVDVGLHGPLRGISQIFVVDSSLTGLAILGGMAAFYSPGLAAHTLMGSTVGLLTAAVLSSGGSVSAELAMGLWGFNSALTSTAVGVFFVHSPQAMVLSVGGAAATASLFGAMKVAFGTSLGVPALTLPFCITATGCYLLAAAKVPGLELAAEPHSPERNRPQ